MGYRTRLQTAQAPVGAAPVVGCDPGAGAPTTPGCAHPGSTAACPAPGDRCPGPGRPLRGLAAHPGQVAGASPCHHLPTACPAPPRARPTLGTHSSLHPPASASARHSPRAAASASRRLADRAQRALCLTQVPPTHFPTSSHSSLLDSTVNFVSGNGIGRPYLASALRPQQLEVFLARAVETAQKTQYLEHEWCELQQAFAYIKYAWEKGQSLFREDLARAMGNSKDMKILSQEYLAVDVYAFVSTFALYFDNAAFQNWAINGYMVAWRQHFEARDNRKPAAHE